MARELQNWRGVTRIAWLPVVRQAHDAVDWPTPCLSILIIVVSTMSVCLRSRSFIRGLVAFAVVVSSTACGGSGGDGPVAPVTPKVSQITLSPLTPTLIVGQSVTLTAEPKDASGGLVTGQGVTWSTSDASVAAVTGGVVTAVKAGSATITATSGIISASTLITVMPAVAQIVITPSPADVIINETVQLTATLRDAAGAEITGRTVTWTSSSDAAATVSTTGLVTGKVVGAVAITATAESRTATVTVNVRPVPVATVTVSPNPLELILGTSGQLTPTTRDAAGNSLGRPVTWSTSNPAVATVSVNGSVTSASVGTATITATSEGKTGTAVVNVVPAPVASVTVTPSTATVEAGESVSLTATVKDGNGQTLTGRTVTWTTSNARATVNGTGVVTAVDTGTVTISATSEGKVGMATVNVVDTKVPVLLSLTLSPDTVKVRTAAAIILVTARLSDGTGIKQFDFQAFSPSLSVIVSCRDTTRDSGTNSDGTFSCSVTIPQGAEAGDYDLRIGALDNSGKALALGSPGLAAQGITPSKLTVQ